MQMVRYAPSPHSSDTVLRGLIKDWSQSGICLMVLQSLEDDQEIKNCFRLSKGDRLRLIFSYSIVFGLHLR